LPDNPSSLIPYDVLRTFEQQGIEYFPYAIGNKVITVGVEDLMRSVELPSASIGPACKVFISYSHKDDDLRAELETHLKLFQRVGLVDSWHDRRLSPGENWRSEIDRNLEGAQLILLLISADFLASDYCYDVEMQRAVQRHIMGDARMLPIIVRDCVWQDAPFADIQALPRDGKPVRLWEDRDSAWKDVVQGIRKAIAQLRARPPIETKLGGQIGVKPII
jgi:internalin A